MGFTTVYLPVTTWQIGLHVFIIKTKTNNTNIKKEGRIWKGICRRPSSSRLLKCL